MSNEPARWYDALPRPQWSQFEPVSQDQDWFDVYRVAAGVCAIYEPGHFEEVISYLVSGRERAALIDTGMGIGDMKRLVSELTDLDVFVLNSHTHFDHVGGNHQFDAIYAMDAEVSRKRSLGMPPSEAYEYVSNRDVFSRPAPHGFERTAYEIKPFQITHTIRDGDTIDLGGRILEVIHTPGHAPDEICVLDAENRLLFTADAFYPAHMYVHLPGSDFDTYATSAGRMAGLADSVDYLLPAHNYTMVEASALTHLDEAFRTIRAGTAEWIPFESGTRKYLFDGFYLILPGE